MTLLKRIWHCIKNLFKKPPKPSPPTPYMPDPTLTVDNRVVSPDSIVFLGNSLTHLAVWQDLFPNAKTANQGVGGDTTLFVLARLQEIINAKPKKIFLLIGANDLNFGVSHSIITEGHRQIIDRITKGTPNTQLYVQSILPFGEKVRNYFPQVPKTWKKDIKALNVALFLLCGRYKIQYLNIAESMTNEKGYLQSNFTADQIHLEKPGYKAWVEHIRQYVE